MIFIIFGNQIVINPRYILIMSFLYIINFLLCVCTFVSLPLWWCRSFIFFVLCFDKKCRKKSQFHHFCRSFSRPRQSIKTIIVVAKTTEKICAHFAHLNASRFHYLLKLHFCFLQAFKLTKHNIQAHLMYDKSHLPLDDEQLSDRQLWVREAFKIFLLLLPSQKGAYLLRYFRYTSCWIMKAKDN